MLTTFRMFHNLANFRAHIYFKHFTFLNYKTTAKNRMKVLWHWQRPCCFRRKSMQKAFSHISQSYYFTKHIFHRKYKTYIFFVHRRHFCRIAFIFTFLRK